MTNEGLAAARARGQRLGRPSAFSPEKVAYAVQLLAAPEQTMSSIAGLLGVSRSTLYTHLPELERAVALAQGAPAVRVEELEHAAGSYTDT